MYRRDGRSRGFGAMAMLGMAIGLLYLAVPASADVTFCPPGTGAGQCDRPAGIAADQSSGEPSSGQIYVADRVNNRINVFEPSGSFLFSFGWGVADGTTKALQKCTATCFKGIAGEGAGQLSSPSSVAVDNDNTSPNYLDVFVYDANNSRVERFDPEGSFEAAFGSAGTGECKFSGSSATTSMTVGPEGVAYVADSPGTSGAYTPTIHKFDSSGACLGQIALAETRRLRSIAVSADGSIYVRFGTGSNVVAKYDPAGTLLNGDVTNGVGARALAVDSGEHLFVAEEHPPLASVAGFANYNTITEYQPDGSIVRRFGYGFLKSVNGIEVFASASGDVMATQGFQAPDSLVTYLESPPPGPVVAPPGVVASAVRSTRATLDAEVNPEGEETTYHFEYVDEESFETEGGFEGPNVVSTPPTALGAEDFGLHAATADIGCTDPETELPEGKCLEPETTYRFRIVATNPDGAGQGTVAGQAFTTGPPIEVTGVWAQDVGLESASLRAEVNPMGIPATGYFEVVSEAQFAESGFSKATQLPAEGTLDFGGGEEPLVRGVSLSGLAQATGYRYRFTAENPLIEPLVGPAMRFRTLAVEQPDSCPNEAFRTGVAALLPDCRAYEMVSPLNKDNGDIIPLGEGTTALPASLDQSSVDGDKFVYGSYRSFGDAEAAPFTSQYLAARGPSGWTSHAIIAARGRINPNPLTTLDTELKALSPDLCNAWFRRVTEPVLAPGAVPGYNNLYKRQDELCGGESYEAITTLAPPSRTPEEYNPLELQGLSADGSAALYVAPDNLPGTGAPPLPGGDERDRQLYLRTAAKTSFVCVLPGGEPSTERCQAGGGGDGLSRTAQVENAISADGQRVFWTAYAGFTPPGRIFMRSRPTLAQSGTILGKCVEPQKACTVAISAKGEELSGTSESQFWAASESGDRAFYTTLKSSAEISDLYEARVEEDSEGNLEVQTRLIANRSAGVLGASEDGTHVYFSSKDALTGANAEGKSPVAGEANLYLDQEGALTFVGTLAPIDVADSDLFPSAINKEPVRRLSRISPDGRHAAFMSAAPLTGYDNTDVASGEADAEIFLFDTAGNGGNGGLRCVSCNPNGGRPHGVDLVDPQSYWAAAVLPAWQNILFAPRVLSDDGTRIFFESTDPLVARDTNGKQDVYQWEELGSGDCEEADATFAPDSGGCIELISSGTSTRASTLLDASPDGSDVFFATLDSLVGQDYGLVDVYVARIGGGYPAPPAPPTQCQGEGCQNPAAPPEAPTPGSETFHDGNGNFSYEKPKRGRQCPKGKRKIKRKGKVRCVKKKRSAKRRHVKRHGHRRVATGRAGR